MESHWSGVPDGGRIKAVQTGGPSGGCIPAEHLILGPFSSKQDWKIDWDTEPMTAMTWCWVGYESIRFCKPQ